MKEMIFAGFGGQGVLTSGLIAINAAMMTGENLTWYPSYGSEMRGGTANCNVKISDDEIASPYCKTIDILFTMNEPAIEKFEDMVKPGGYLFVNTSLVGEGRTYRDDVNVVKVNATDLATQVKNSKGSNIVMLGAVMKATDLYEKDFFIDAMCNFFEKKGKGKFNPKNIEAFEAGYAAV